MQSNIIIIILCVISVVFSKHHHHHKTYHHFHLADILYSKENFFSTTNSYVQNIMNKIFEDLDLPEQFTDEPKIKLLLTMHYDLNNIAEKNFEIYDVLRNVTAVIVDNSKAVNKIRLDEMVREILNEIKFNVHDEIKDKENKPTSRSIHTTKKPMAGFNDSREFKQFIRDFLGKVKSLTVKDLFKKKKHSSKLFNARKNLKVWEPPPVIETDWALSNNTESRRIYRGKKTNIVTFPFVVSVHILEDFTCAGSIIGRDLVLTAASCVQIHYNNRFFRENPKTTFVRIGSDWTSRRGELVPVLEIFFYPTYDPKTLKHNIAVLRLERVIKYETRSRTKIRRIQLDQGDGNLPSNTREVVILGWGAKKPNQIINNFEKLTVSFLNIFPLDECRNIYSKEFVSESNFCAGYLSRGGGACNRDVGAPGVVGGVLVGIVSFGAPVCGALNAPTVYTRVGHYINWIEPIIENHQPRYGKPKTTKMTSKALVYYFNTVTARTYPHIKPISANPFRPLARAQDEIPEEDVLQEILSATSDENDTMIHDIINHDLTDDFYNILNDTEEDFVHIAEHPLINKTLYLIPGIHFETTVSPNLTTTTTTVAPTFLFETTNSSGPDPTAAPLRMTADVYGAYDNNNYEYTFKDKQKKKNGYDYKDSQESRQEYFDKMTNKPDYDNVEAPDGNNQGLAAMKITQPIYEIKAATEDDYSRDVAYEI